MNPECTQRPAAGQRCDTCPTSGWPTARQTALAGSDPAGRSLALRDFTASARCRWDHPGGPVDWQTGEPVDEAAALASCG